MAQMIPEVEDTSTIRPLSEQTVYVALRDQLSADYIVFHSFHWLRRWRGTEGAGLQEGEADFVLIHPALGLLVLEVKGGEIFTEQWRWRRRTEHGIEDLQEPFAQARKSMHALLKILKKWADRHGHRLPIGGKDTPMTYGYAVFFPDMNYTGSPPADAEDAIILCNRHLLDLEPAVRAALRQWREQPRPLTQAEFNTVFQGLTARPVFIRPVGAEIRSAREQLLHLPESQSAAYRALLRGRTRVLVQGPAGSGKTELALTRAAELAHTGKRVLLICYNAELAQWMRERRDQDPALAGLSDHLHIDNFHHLASSLAKESGLDWQPEDSETFWNERATDILGAAVERLERQGHTVRYDAILLDEAQDFYEMWWWALADDLLIDDEQAPLLAFMDPNQALRASASVPADVGLDAPIIITENCRNTRRIAALSARTIGVPLSLFSRAPEGSVPHIIWARSKPAMKQLVVEEVRRLLEVHSLRPEQIVLVGISKKTGSLAGVDELAGAPLTRSAAQWRQGGHILATTARSFKGLEADVVVIFDFWGLSTYFTVSDLYVACTRARFHLSVIIGHDRELRGQLEMWAKAKVR